MSIFSPYASRTTGCEEAELVAGPTDGLMEGQIRRQVHLGTEAIYRVCDLGRSFVRVEVIRAPGLRTGQHFKFSRRDVAHMDLLGSEAEDHGPLVVSEPERPLARRAL